MADADDDRGSGGDGAGGAELTLVRALAEVLTRADLGEIAFEKGDLRIRLTRQPPAMALPAVGSAAVAVAAPAAVAVAEPADEHQALLAHPGLLTSPMVGVVYNAPEPGAPPFVAVGDTVKAGDPVLLIEAMKVFNPISAPKAGRIQHVFVGNGQPVEFGEPLLVIE